MAFSASAVNVFCLVDISIKTNHRNYPIHYRRGVANLTDTHCYMQTGQSIKMLTVDKSDSLGQVRKKYAPLQVVVGQICLSYLHAEFLYLQ